MAILRINFGDYERQIAKSGTMDEESKRILSEVMKSLQKQFDELFNVMVTKENLGSQSGTFISADVPAKTITVTNGLISKGV